MQKRSERILVVDRLDDWGDLDIVMTDPSVTIDQSLY